MKKMEIGIETGVVVILIGMGILMAGLGIAIAWSKQPVSELSQALEACRFGCDSWDLTAKQNCFIECLTLIDLNYSQESVRGNSQEAK